MDKLLEKIKQSNTTQLRAIRANVVTSNASSTDKSTIITDIDNRLNISNTTSSLVETSTIETTD